MTYSSGENVVAPLSCASPMTLTILYAFFGPAAGTSCSCGLSPCSIMVVTSKVSTQCRGLSMCWFNATDVFFSDPCYGSAKTFQLTISAVKRRKLFLFSIL